MNLRREEINHGPFRMNGQRENSDSFRIPGDAYGFFLEELNSDLTMTLLDSTAPYVWIPHHRPLLYMKWWEAEVPINEDGKQFRGRIRNLDYDLLISLNDFARLKDAIMSEGFELYQSLKPIPDTLMLDHIPHKNRLKVLRDNNVILGINQPSRGDFSFFWTFRVEILNRVISQKGVAEQIIRYPIEWERRKPGPIIPNKPQSPKLEGE